ncbi:hypothetical protein ALC60_09396, partial [Trachymyrmex zeteki]
FKKNITDGSRCPVGNSGCAAFCALRNELKFDQNFLFNSASNLTRIIFRASATILFQNEGLRYGNNHSPSVHTISSIRRQRVPMGAPGCDRSKSFLASFLDSHVPQEAREEDLCRFRHFPTFSFPLSIGLHYTLPGVFQRSLKLSKMQQANSTNKPGESCSTSTLVASTRVVSYMEKHAT